MDPDLQKLLSQVVDHPDTFDDQREAFRDMLEADRPLSEKQRAWLFAVARRLGLESSENLFSGWSEAKKAEEKRRAAKVLLPHEMPGYVKPEPIRRKT